MTNDKIKEMKREWIHFLKRHFPNESLKNIESDFDFRYKLELSFLSSEDMTEKERQELAMNRTAKTVQQWLNYSSSDEFQTINKVVNL
mgnify:CR=1 FL=1|tara:strand:- start:224 stop:487 length:264 start_codon:yes stop_codon:yes gene_type:complete